MENKRELKFILKYYGEEAQAAQTIEEIKELEKAIVIADSENMIEEMADVEIMLEQLKMFRFFDEDEFKRIKEFKINRQLGRISKEMRNTNE